VSIAESFGRSHFAKFVNTTAGRLVRVVVGIALIALGYMSRGSTMGIILMVVGLIPLTAGAFNLCLISALLGGPIRGAQVGAGIQSRDSQPDQES
jgi:hypothetical protein